MSHLDSARVPQKRSNEMLAVHCSANFANREQKAVKADGLWALGQPETGCKGVREVPMFLEAPSW